MQSTLKLLDFNIYDKKPDVVDDFQIDEDNLCDQYSGSAAEEEGVSFKDWKYQYFKQNVNIDKRQFEIQMFGLNEKGETFSVFVKNYNPFFYISVDDSWGQAKKNAFLDYLDQHVGDYFKKGIVSCKLIKRKKLYGFDGNRQHRFLFIEFANTIVMSKVKNIFYTINKNKERKLSKNGFKFGSSNLYLYEANIPPLLRCFHIQEISPSGWIELPESKTDIPKKKTTTCDYEYEINVKDIKPLNDKEDIVPYKICSFDIEASSSHGDFPLPIKYYKKLAHNILEIHESMQKIDEILDNIILKKIIFTAFGYDDYQNVDKIYTKKSISMKKLQEKYDRFIESLEIRNSLELDSKINNIDKIFEKINDEDDNNNYQKNKKCEKMIEGNIFDLLNNKSIEREEKINIINKLCIQHFPEVEGDKVTFIGSTFLKFGESKPYLNHCAVLDTCTDVNDAEIETYDNEKDVLLAWTKLIQRENPDIIIGYNIFGFDHQFLFQRALENRIEDQFCNLSRNKNELCYNTNDKGEKSIQESSIVIASGQHDLHFIKMTGRLQIDLYNFFRRDYNLTSYKLDYVSGYFIGDNVKKIEYDKKKKKTKIYSKNLTGLEEDTFIHFEETSHSTDYYKDGKKCKVSEIDQKDGSFYVDGNESPDMTKQVKWGMAKDDVTPQDIFRMTNEGPDERSVIAKYCIQDCNLVHHLMNKIDVMTGYMEMAKICSVPINFLVMRGQGIKLTSYIGKKCREKGTLLPTLEKPDSDDGYEGAIVLEPKCDLYLDNPVACVDYSSLYPSSMISENLSHDSKVWTKEYDLKDNLIQETGVKDKNGEFIYDNLDDYKYVDVTYDTFKYVRKTEKSAAVKVKKGYKICRFAQFPEGKAIMPSILEELLASRKATRKLIPQQKDEFMKNILDKRQLSYKLTANSLYGQCGARTSTFYEKDVAASTTATGRKLLTYAKRLIEDVYGDLEVETKYGRVKSNAEYIYGDTDSVFFTFNFTTLDGKKIVGKQALEMTIDLAQEAGELASQYLKKPHDLEYEKTFMPFCLLSKKRYVGMLYETDPDKGKRKSMGIVLKRRDNAPIVKDVYGGIIDILMKDQNIEKAADYLKECLQNIIDEQYPLEKLIISKSLRSNYKNPAQIAHKVLADRMGVRDPGTKPGNGDRIPYVYINTKNKNALQGDKIEHPDYIRKNKIKPNYTFYITNQIMKPVQQVFALVLEKMEKFKRKRNNFVMKIETLKQTMEDHEKCIAKINDLRNKEVKTLLFDPYLRETTNSAIGNQSIKNFFQSK